MRGKSKRGGKAGKIVKYALLSALLFALAAFIWRLDLPHWKKLNVAAITDMPGTTTVYDASGVAVGALNGGENREWVSLSKIPGHVQDAFIAAEDLRFYRHNGIDLYRLLGALWHDIRTFSYGQGGSTITQQLVKLTHLTQAKTLSRKAQEIVLALKLERVMDKSQILEAYLNAVYFGHGAYGIEAAAKTYFGKPASELTLSEGALLAGVIKSPSTYAPHLNEDKAVTRRDGILGVMAENDMITDSQRDEARKEPVRLVESGDGTHFAWYMDAVLTEASKALNLTADEVLSGGYAIHTGLDAAMQGAAEALFTDADRFPRSAADGTPAQAALAALDTESGELRAVVGGRRYDVRRGLNRATQAARQPGSAFKPVSTYAAAVDAYGYVPASIVDDTPRTFEGDYTPGNAGGASYGRVTLRQALSRSLNIATVALADEIGTSALRTYAQRFGLPLSPEDRNLSMALGALTDGVTPIQLGAAYCALANGGTRVTPHAIRSIEDGDGNEIYRATAAGERAVSPQAAYMVTDMLRTAATSGSAKALASCPMPVAGKTGTVSEAGGGNRDAWTVAYTPDVAVSVWMGFDEPGVDHSLPSGEGGSGYPARLCAAFLTEAASSLNGKDFKKPSGVRTALLDGVALNRDAEALLCTDNTPVDEIAMELFNDGSLPTAFSDNWEAPEAPADLRLLTKPGETPVMAFTSLDGDAQYVVTRAVNGVREEVAVLTGEAGHEIRYADTGHDLAQVAEYAILPRNGLLYERGELLTGPLSASVRYAPGGLLNAIMGVGAAEATPTPTEVDDTVSQSLFS